MERSVGMTHTAKELVAANQRIVRSKWTEADKQKCRNKSKEWYDNRSLEQIEKGKASRGDLSAQWRKENLATARALWRDYHHRKREAAGLPPLPTYEPGVAYYIMVGKKAPRKRWWLAVGERCLMCIKKDGSVYKRTKMSSYSYVKAGPLIMPRGKFKVVAKDPNHLKKTVKKCCYVSEVGDLCNAPTTRVSVRCDAHVGVWLTVKWRAKGKKAREDQKITRAPRRVVEEVVALPALEFLARTWHTTVEVLEEQIAIGKADDEAAIAALAGEKEARDARRHEREEVSAQVLEESIALRRSVDLQKLIAQRDARNQKKAAKAKRQAEREAKHAAYLARKEKERKERKDARLLEAHRRRARAYKAKARRAAIAARRAEPTRRIVAEPGVTYLHWKRGTYGIAVNDREILVLRVNGDVQPVPATTIFERCERKKTISVAQVREQWGLSIQQFDDLIAKHLTQPRVEARYKKRDGDSLRKTFAPRGESGAYQLEHAG